MELEFKKEKLDCLRRCMDRTVSAEQTMELQLQEHSAPVSRVLGAWGQWLLRGKQWQEGFCTAEGGVEVRALYESTDGTVQWVEGWIPFSLRWELPPEQEGEGQLMVSCSLKAVEARQVGAQRLLLRAAVSATALGLQRQELTLWWPAQPTDTVALLTKEHRVCLAVAGGEELVELEQELILPPGSTELQQVLLSQLQPRLTEQRVVEEQLLLRGTAALHMAYLGEDGLLHAYDTQLPLNHLAAVGVQGAQSSVLTLPAVTKLELERLDGSRLLLRAGVLIQYAVQEQRRVQVVADAYCPGRELEVERQELCLPSVAPPTEQPLEYQCVLGLEQDPVFTGVLVPQPGAQQELSGTVSALYYDEQGSLRCKSAGFSCPLPQEQGQWACLLRGAPPRRQGQTVQGTLPLVLWQQETLELEQLCAVTVGQRRGGDRPGLILTRRGNADLWTLAKACGSTVEAILQANGLQEEPPGDRLLLIPVK